MKLTDLLPLITVWLQVRVLPGPPMNQWFIKLTGIALSNRSCIDNVVQNRVSRAS